MPLPPFSNQQMSMTPSYTIGPSPQSILPTYTRALQPNMSMFTNNMQGHFPRDMFPDLDMSNHNFQNNYGLGEFAMLNHMSSGMAETPPGESSGTFNSSDDANFGPGMMSTNYESGPANAQNYRFPHDLGICETSHHSRPGSRQALDVANYNLAGQDQDCLEGVVKQEERPAYAVGASYPSPISGSSPQGMTAGFDDSPTVKNMYTNLSSSRQAQAQVQARRSARPGQQPQSVSTTSPSTITAPSYPRAQTLPPQRHRTPSTIYSTVTEPYSYTKAFHDLMALIRKRFSAKKTARIAKALASIRPSFISSLTKLDDDDRVFMEKCLQRTLLEYEDFLSVIGTPTIICRRTGEVVAVGEGFSVLTGWRKAILLGEEPNFNVNKGGDSSGPPNTDASTTRGNNTPRVTDGPRPEIHDDSPLKPVSIVDLLDDESACDFFDDYSHLAFGDSRGSVTTPCRLLKYQTAKDVGVGQNLDSEVGTRLKRQRDANWSGKADSAAGVNVHSGGPNKVECMLCWSVKRDVFDIPMLFVMNFLPCI